MRSCAVPVCRYAGMPAQQPFARPSKISNKQERKLEKLWHGWMPDEVHSEASQVKHRSTRHQPFKNLRCSKAKKKHVSELTTGQPHGWLWQGQPETWGGHRRQRKRLTASAGLVPSTLRQAQCSGTNLSGHKPIFLNNFKFHFGWSSETSKEQKMFYIGYIANKKIQALISYLQTTRIRRPGSARSGWIWC